MTYTKPEINILGDAAQIIQDGTKLEMFEYDAIVLHTTLFPAYDLDE